MRRREIGRSIRANYERNANQEPTVQDTISEYDVRSDISSSLSGRSTY